MLLSSTAGATLHPINDRRLHSIKFLVETDVHSLMPDLTDKTEEAEIDAIISPNGKPFCKCSQDDIHEMADRLRALLTAACNVRRDASI